MAAPNMEGTLPIPSPPGLPFLGNIKNINPELPLESFIDMADKYGPIWKLHFPGRSMIFVANHELVNEVCDEKRFGKTIGAVLGQVRNGVHDGLFTAHSDEPNWGIAHRVLMPAFGPTKIQSMFDDMHDIAAQLAMKWARHGPSAPIHVTDDFTRLTLDTLALCAMDYRFNSYYHDEMHPFIEAMGDFLVASGNRSRRPPLPSIFYREADEKYNEDIAMLRDTAEDVLKARKANPTDRKDLLTAMLEGVDSKTGQKLSDSSIIDNLITFLIAGHETTSGLLSFAFYQLLKHPEAYRKAQEEVDTVIGEGPIKVEHMGKLPYLAAILRETLRLSATIPAFSVGCKEDTIIGGKYFIPKGQDVSLLLAKSQLDPAVFGETAKEFIPERMLDENFDRLNKEFPNCWKPFGNGMRACIGRPFAWQEALLVMAMLLQNFNFMLDDPNYNLKIKQTLTIKPKDFFMRASLRHGITPTELEHRLAGDKIVPSIKKEPSGVVASSKAKAKGKPLSIYYGSNTGTCESLAQRLASDAGAHGWQATVVDALDAAHQNLPADQPVVIITASYEGQPPDNAAIFVNWLENLKGKELEKVSYAVYGCGHHDWAQTFHRIPKLVDAKLEELGGTRIAPIGVTDAAQGNMFTDFESWEDEILWPALAEKYGVAAQGEGDGIPSGLSIEISSPRSSTLRQDVKEAIVVDVQTLTAPGAPPKKHMEIQLPSDARYTAGDYLAVLPLNPKVSVERVMRRFHLAWDAHITISASGRTTLPTGVSIPVNDVLGAYVELAQPATRRGILSLVEATKDESTRQQLTKLSADADTYTAQISAKRVSILDLLERFPSVDLPFSTFLALLPPMRVRQYSISSSPLWNPTSVTLTYSLLDAPSLADPEGSRHHLGVASSYLSSLAPGDKLHVSVRPSHSSFHLPTDAANTPIILVGAGSGIAPFRGFIQERAAQIAAGRKLAPALLFFGCRSPDKDDIYREELDRWEGLGAVAVRRAYSRSAGEDAKGCRYVQDRLWLDREEVTELWKRGAKVYVCGSRSVGEAVKKVVIKIAEEDAVKEGRDVNDEKITKWFDGIKNERFATDVFD
ncbi:putative bifunctional P-450:NADPH-P450 reductase [Coniochaeta sp. PMI_546]|nr:putative bifunctional P-450:NADPH-P450 reductase [Coniochaeta sp. PMI_546]